MKAPPPPAPALLCRRAMRFTPDLVYFCKMSTSHPRIREGTSQLDIPRPLSLLPSSSCKCHFPRGRRGGTALPRPLHASGWCTFLGERGSRLWAASLAPQGREAAGAPGRVGQCGGRTLCTYNKPFGFHRSCWFVSRFLGSSLEGWMWGGPERGSAWLQRTSRGTVRCGLTRPSTPFLKGES